MKVQIERTFPSCPSTLKCTACDLRFPVSRIRALLCTDNGLIQGDLCPTCLESGETGIQRKLKIKAFRALQNAHQVNAIAAYQQSLIQLEQAEMPIQLPRFYHWWLKKIEIFAQEAQELETARLGLSGCQCNKARQKLHIAFQSDFDPKEGHSAS